jgi:hypothetical protein
MLIDLEQWENAGEMQDLQDLTLFEMNIGDRATLWNLAGFQEVSIWTTTRDIPSLARWNISLNQHWSFKSSMKIRCFAAVDQPSTPQL